MNSFADVEWLPEPGTTPDAWNYGIDSLAEQAELAFAGTGSGAMALALEFSREKLAEASAMILAGDAAAAARALDHYADYLARATAAAVLPGAGTLRSRLVEAMLEHMYFSLSRPALGVLC